MLDLHFYFCKCKGGRGKALLRAKAACEPFHTPLPRGAGGGAGGAGGLRRLFPAASMPGIVRSERRALPTCPPHAWQAAACKAWRVLHADCVACCILPLLLWRGAGWVAASPPFMCLSQRVLLGFAKSGAALSPPAAWSFGKEFSSLVIGGSGCFAMLRWLLGDA